MIVTQAMRDNMATTATSFAYGQRQERQYRWGRVLLVFWLVMGGVVHAADETLDTVIDRVQARYDRTAALTADFVQVATLTSIDRQQTSTGRLSVEKPHFIRWEYRQPDVQTILYDGNLLQIYTPKRQQVLQSPIDEKSRSDVALLFLAGIGKLRDAFLITPLEARDTPEKLFRLVPRSRQASFTELQIVVNPHSYFIEQLTIYDTIGNVTEIRLQALQTHTELPPQTFELVLPPNTEILTPKDVSGQH
jgi:outer membrane lipoprotein carrier protein